MIGPLDVSNLVRYFYIFETLFIGSYGFSIIVVPSVVVEARPCRGTVLVIPSGLELSTSFED